MWFVTQLHILHCSCHCYCFLVHDQQQRKDSYTVCLLSFRCSKCHAHASMMSGIARSHHFYGFMLFSSCFQVVFKFFFRYHLRVVVSFVSNSPQGQAEPLLLLRTLSPMSKRKKYPHCSRAMQSQSYDLPIVMVCTESWLSSDDFQTCAEVKAYKKPNTTSSAVHLQTNQRFMCYSGRSRSLRSRVEPFGD